MSDIITDTVSKNGMMIGYVVPEILTDELIILALQQNNAAIQYIPDNKMTQNVCKYIVTLSDIYGALRHIPDCQMSDEVLEAAIRSSAGNIKHVPYCLITDNIVNMIIKYHSSIYLKDIPEHKIPYDVIKTMVQQDGRNLIHVPESRITNDIIREAIKQDPKKCCLLYVPDHMITYGLAMFAVRINGFNLSYVPEHLITLEMAYIAIEQYGYCLSYVPKHMITYDLAMNAIKMNKTISHDQYGCDSCYLSCVPKHIITYEMAYIAVRNDGLNLIDVPNDMITQEMIMMALQQNGLILQYVPKDEQTDEMIMMAIQKNYEAIRYVSKKRMTYDIILYGIRINVKILQYIPSKKITTRIIKKALLCDHFAYKYIRHNLYFHNRLNNIIGTKYNVVANSKESYETFAKIYPHIGHATNNMCLICNTTNVLIDIHNDGSIIHCYCYDCFITWFCDEDNQTNKCIMCNEKLNINDIRIVDF